MSKAFLVPICLEQFNLETPISEIIKYWKEQGSWRVWQKGWNFDNRILLANLEDVEYWLAYENHPFDLNEHNYRFVDEEAILSAE